METTEKDLTLEDEDEITKDWDFTIMTVADCMAEKISPKEFLPTTNISINMSWTHIIAMINRKCTSDKKIKNTQVSVAHIIKIYGKMMNKTFF